MATKKRKSNYAAREAHRKNVERAKVQAQAAKRKAFFDKYRKHFIIGIPALIILIVGIWLICKATIGPGGSIPNFFGNLRGVEDNWIVTNQGTTKAPRYYKMGTFTAPEGYTLDPDYQVSSDALNRTFYYTADDENALIQSVYVAGIKEKSAQEMIDTVSGYSLYVEEATVSDDPIAGLNAKWLLGKINDAEETEEQAAEETEEEPVFEIGHVQMNVYVDSVQNASVLVFMNSKSKTPAEELPSQEEFLAAAEKILAGLSVEAAK